MNIGQLSATSGVSSKLIRHYESIGLVPKARRSDSGYRTYTNEDVQFLRFIKRARSLGFSIKEIKSLTSLWRNKKRASKDVKSLAQMHITDLETKISQMQEMADNLKKLIHKCHGDSRPECPILDSLESQ